MQDRITNDSRNDGVDRRGFLKCMAWAGTGMVWAVSGGILGWLCSDDLLEPRAVRFVLDYFSEHPQASFVYGDAKLIGANGELLKIRKEIPFNWFLWKYLDHNYIPQSSAFWRRNLHREVNGLDETFDLGMDADLFARFAERAELCHVKKVLSSVRSYPQAKSQRMRTDSIDDMRRICLRYGVDHSRRHIRALKLVAKLYRCSWKAATGCYSANQQE